jgi:hypothetical protein
VEAGETAQGTTTGDVTRGFGSAIAVSGIILGLLLIFYYRIEFYPFTSWTSLYTSSNTSGKVRYKKVFAQYESGVSSPARLEETIGALAWDARYSKFLAKCFQDQPEAVAVCKKFLSAAAVAYNKKAPPGERVTHYEIQAWTWDFRSYHFDKNYGNMTGRFILEISTGRALREEMTVVEHSRTDPAPPLASDAVKNGAGVAR